VCKFFVILDKILKNLFKGMQAQPDFFQKIPEGDFLKKIRPDRTLPEINFLKIVPTVNNLRM